VRACRRAHSSAACLLTRYCRRCRGTQAPSQADIDAAFDALSGGAATIRPHVLLQVASSLGFSSWTHEECASMTALSSSAALNRSAFSTLVNDVRARVPS
jgi:hypothetical protein